MPFDLFMGLFYLAFFLILAMIVVQMVRGISQWGRNNASPRLTVEASIVAKREQHGQTHDAATHTAHGYTRYFATFQVESGDRMELEIPARDIGLLAEGDRGRLTFQGTRFLGFERQ